MIRIKPKYHRGDGSGIRWPKDEPTEPNRITSAFGPRPFTLHITTVGYNYDFHRGIDISASLGEPVYSPINGSVIRAHETHYNWKYSDQLNRFTVLNPNSNGTFTFVTGATPHLLLNGIANGNFSHISSSAKLKHNKEKIVPHLDDFTIELELSSTISLTDGRIGLGITNQTNTEYASLEYDGNVFYIYGVHSSGAMNVNNTFVSSSGKTWLRLDYVLLPTSSISWQYSTDGDTFTTLATSSSLNFTDGYRPVYDPIIYWKSTTNTNTTSSIKINAFNWVDYQTVGRFGNWMFITDGNKRISVQHCDTINVTTGDIIQAGHVLGKVGDQGFDSRSGRIRYPHPHVEIAPGSNYINTINDSVNPLNPIYFPRIDTTNNTVVTRSTANDPDGVESWRLVITQSRNQEDIDLNYIALTGNLASRAINFNTRLGLNSDQDIPKLSGVYISASSFNENNTYSIRVFFFNKSVVGTSFTSFTVQDTQGNILASE